MAQKLRKEKELNQIKKSTNVLFNIIFIILSALCIFPIVFVFSISISSETSIQKNGYQLIPQELSAAAYQFLWNERGTILHATFISMQHSFPFWLPRLVLFCQYC